MLVFTGPSGSGKTHRILGEFREAVKQNRPEIRLVLPTATLVQHLRHELARSGLVFRPRTILTLSAFTSELCGELALADSNVITLAVEHALREVTAPEFARVSSMPGFHAELVQTLGELDSAGCTPEEFARIRPEAQLARPLLAVWRVVERELRTRNLHTRSQLLRHAAHQAATMPNLPQRIWFDGFVGFTRPELLVIEAVAKRSEVTVALPALDTAKDALDDLLVAGSDFEELSAPRDPEDAPALEAAWFQAENAEREADEIARRILLYQSSGRDFREIAVVLRTAAETRPLLANTFERFGIPARFYFHDPLDEHPVPMFCLRLAQAILSHWDFEATLAALRLMPGLEGSPALDIWDVTIRENIPGAGLDELRALGVTASDRFREYDAWRTAQWSAARWADVLSELPERFPPPRPRDGLSSSAVAIERTQSAAANAWTEVLQTSANWLGTERFLTLEEFWKTAGSVARLGSFETPDARRNVVHVMSVFEARQWDPAVMFLPNMTEKIFPRHHPQNAFLPDSAIQQLKAAGIRMRDSRDRDAEEASLFDAVAQRPLAQGAKRRDICLSFPRRNARGDENMRSSFFARLRASESSAVTARPALAAQPIPLRRLTPVRSADLLQVIATRHACFSPSSLEIYARCPFQFYANKTLRLKSLPDTPEERLGYLEQGTIVHDVLKQWTAVRGEVAPLFNSVFAGMCRKEHVQSTYRTEVLRRQMLGDLSNFCSTFQTYGLGESQTELAFELEVLPTVRLRGRIDRVDSTAEGGAVIVDYKYSNNTRQNVGDESKLQGVLYTIAAERAFGLQPQAMIFIGVKKDNRPFGWGKLGDHDFAPISDQWITKGLDTLVRIADEIRGGVVQPAPSDEKHCGYCDYRDACRYGEAEAARGA